MIGPRRVDKPLVLYGYGKLGHLAEEIFKELGFGFTISEQAKPAPVYRHSLVAVCIAAEPYQTIKQLLINFGYYDIHPVYDIIEAYPEVGLHNGWFTGTISEEDAENYFFVMDHLHTQTSKDHYSEFAIWRTNHHETPTFSPFFFPHSLPSTLADIRQRQRVETFMDAPMHHIQIHNEGCELKTLEENVHLFQKYRPAIDVAVYHSRDGLWKIEKFLMENLSRYEWSFRLTAYMGQGAYIFGRPKEKMAW